MYESIKLNDVFSLVNAEVNMSNSINVVPLGRRTADCPSGNSLYVARLEHIAYFVEYIQRPFSGSTLLIEGAARSGKTSLPREMSARLGADYHFFDASQFSFTLETITANPDFMSSLRPNCVYHVDNADALPSIELKRITDFFAQNSVTGSRLVLSSSADVSIGGHGLRPIYVDLPTVNEIELAMANCVAGFGLEGIKETQAHALVATIAEVLKEAEVEPLGYEPVLAWLVEAITMLMWGLAENNVFIESLQALNAMVSQDVISELSNVADRIVDCKKQEAQAKSQKAKAA